MTSMELKAGDVLVKGQIQERGEAQEQFQEAKEKGHRSAIMTQERAEIHTLKVTNIPPQTEIIICFTLVEFLDSKDGLFIWRFPTTIAPHKPEGRHCGKQCSLHSDPANI